MLIHFAYLCTTGNMNTENSNVLIETRKLESICQWYARQSISFSLEYKCNEDQSGYLRDHSSYSSQCYKAVALLSGRITREERKEKTVVGLTQVCAQLNENMCQIWKGTLSHILPEAYLISA